MARPSSYTPKKAAEICELLASGISLRKICERDDMPEQPAVFRWLFNNEEFRKQYALAREAWADAEFEKIFSIADDGTNDWEEREGKHGSTYMAVNTEAINRSRLRVDTRKWALARMSPKKYGEKVFNELTGKDGAPLYNDDTRDKKLAALMASVKLRTAPAAPTEEGDDVSDLA